MINQLTTSEKQIIEEIKQKIQHEFKDDASGHDWWHIYRVHQVANTLATQEKEVVDLFVVQAAALLHDLEDWKFNDAGETTSQKARQMLIALKAPTQKIEFICEIIDHVSFKGANVASLQSSLEGKIVQDADRLDAIGAIGVGRAFAYGGNVGRLMYDPNRKAEQHTTFEAYKKSQSPTINHFYEKLLLLKDKMNTDSGRKLAEHRHKFMEEFLEEFLAEWDGNL
jgi:uncharacterized protein